MKSKFFDFFLIFLILSLGFFFFRLIRENGVLAQKVEQQALQASSLISEVGETKEEAHTIFQELLQSKQTIEELERAFSQLNKKSYAPEVVSIKISESQNSQKVPRKKQEEKVPASTTTNFLLVGHRGRLADSIIVAAVSENKKLVTLISIPRDLFVNGRKLNEYLSLYGAETLVEKVEDVIGLSIHEYVVVNFQAFETIIDALGGIDVYVNKAIYDNSYPTEAGGYIVYSIDDGAHHLSGAEALKYARSRHSTSDFDRATRQQHIVRALQERIINFDFVRNRNELEAIYEALKDGIETSISIAEAIYYISTYQYFSIASDNILSTSNFLSPSATLNGQYILVPKGGGFAGIKEYVRKLLHQY